MREFLLVTLNSFPTHCFFQAFTQRKFALQIMLVLQNTCCLQRCIVNTHLMTSQNNDVQGTQGNEAVLGSQVTWLSHGDVRARLSGLSDPSPGPDCTKYSYLTSLISFRDGHDLDRTLRKRKDNSSHILWHHLVKSKRTVTTM